MLSDVNWNKLLFLRSKIVTKQTLVMVLEVSEEGSGPAALFLLSCSIPLCQSLVAAGRSEGTVWFWLKPITWSGPAAPAGQRGRALTVLWLFSSLPCGHLAAPFLQRLPAQISELRRHRNGHRARDHARL